ncbi:MAG: head-tail adaptor protein [Pseudomonadota bacterium]
MSAALSWASQGSVWAEIGASGTSESADYDSAPSVAVYDVTIRTRDDARAGWRMVWGARTLRITGVRDDGGPRIVLVCEEESL